MASWGYTKFTILWTALSLLYLAGIMALMLLSAPTCGDLSDSTSPTKSQTISTMIGAICAGLFVYFWSDSLVDILHESTEGVTSVLTDVQGPDVQEISGGNRFLKYFFLLLGCLVLTGTFFFPVIGRFEPKCDDNVQNIWVKMRNFLLEKIWVFWIINSVVWFIGFTINVLIFYQFTKRRKEAAARRDEEKMEKEAGKSEEKIAQSESLWIAKVLKESLSEASYQNNLLGGIVKELETIVNKFNEY